VHVAQINFLRAPADCPPDALFERWPSLADIPEAAASSGTRVSVIQVATHTCVLTRHGIDYHFVDLRGMHSPTTRGRFLADLVADIGGQVLHVHSLGFAADAFAVAQRLPRVPILIQDHADRPPRWWRRPRWRTWYAAASGIAFTSPGLAGPPEVGTEPARSKRISWVMSIRARRPPKAGPPGPPGPGPNPAGGRLAAKPPVL